MSLLAAIVSLRKGVAEHSFQVALDGATLSTPQFNTQTFPTHP
ncbi:MAG: hypothetical protein QOI58_4006 [Thermoanaerobaculia bacterium]|jgi:hypothetical protein|nr:hypothetical protein [Thermoanaerobaculia bacterium]